MTDETPVAPVLELFVTPESNPVEYDEDDIQTDDLTLEDLAFIAHRILVNVISQLDLEEASQLAYALIADEQDIKIVKAFMEQAKVTVDIPGF